MVWHAVSGTACCLDAGHAGLLEDPVQIFGVPLPCPCAPCPGLCFSALPQDCVCGPVVALFPEAHGTGCLRALLACVPQAAASGMGCLCSRRPSIRRHTNSTHRTRAAMSSGACFHLPRSTCCGHHWACCGGVSVCAGYMSMISIGFFCLTGTMGFYACYIFVRQIYGAVKID